MKKLFLILIVCLISGFSYADNDAVSMVSFEQNWTDQESTLALKNNTDEKIYNVQYVIEYLDMNGVQMDYATFSSDVVIEPGMTKKLDIPAYEHDRYYSYYQSKALPSDPYKFKVNFVLKSYNQENVAEDDYEHISEKDVTYGVILAFVAILIILGLVIGCYVLVAVVASKNNRNVVLWVLLSFIASPLLVLIILLCIGKDIYDEG